MDSLREMLLDYNEKEGERRRLLEDVEQLKRDVEALKS